MGRIISLLFVAAVALGAAGSAFAGCLPERGTRTPRVNQRQRHQQRRIGQGVRSGELTGRETLRLEREQYRIQQDKREAREDGTVTARERVALRRELNHSSRHIYRAKHNNRDRN